MTPPADNHEKHTPGVKRSRLLVVLYTVPGRLRCSGAISEQSSHEQRGDMRTSMLVHLDISALLITASCPLRGGCNWWTSDMGPLPLFIWGVFLGLIGLAILV